MSSTDISSDLGGLDEPSPKQTPVATKPVTTMQFRTPLVGQLQARLTTPGLVGEPVEGGKIAIDIVEWAEDFSHCWTVAYIEPTAESANFRSIGNRLLDVKWHELERVTRMSYAFLEGVII